MKRQARERIIAIELAKLERRQALERAARPAADRTDAPAAGPERGRADVAAPGRRPAGRTRDNG
jgi:hypothetical protein